MKKTLIAMILVTSTFTLVGCSSNKEVYRESDNTNITESINNDNVYENDYTLAFDEIKKFDENEYIPYEKLKDNELVKDIKTLLVDYWANGGQTVYKNGVQFDSSKGTTIPFSKEKINKLKEARDAIITKLDGKKITDINIIEISWDNYLQSDKHERKYLRVRYRLVDSEGNEYQIISIGDLSFNLYSNDGAIKLYS